MRLSHCLYLVVAASACGNAPAQDAILPWFGTGFPPVSVVGAIPAQDRCTRQVVDSVVVRPSEASSATPMFSGVRSARLFADRLVIGDSRDFKILVFDTAGTFERAFAGKGQGPGELSSFAWARPWRGDSLAVYDLARRTVVVFSFASGKSRQVEFGLSREWVHDVLGPSTDGSFVAIPTASRRPVEPTLHRLRNDTLPYVAFHEQRPAGDTLGWFIDDDAYPMTVQRANETRRPLTRSEKDAYAKEYVASRREVFRPLLEVALRELKVDGLAPLLGELVGGLSTPVVLVSDFSPVPRSHVKWHVLSEDTRYLHCVELPRDRRPVDVSASRVVTIGRDAFDVEYVVIYTIT